MEAVQRGGDVVTEDTGKGADRVYADVDYTLTANVERLTLLGLALAGTGNIGQPIDLVTTKPTP